MKTSIGTSFYFNHRILRHIVGRPRLLVSAALGMVAYLALPHEWRIATRVLLSWNAATFVYIAWTLWGMARASEAAVRRHAVMTDESRYIVLVLAIVAAGASLSAIVSELAASKDLSGGDKEAHLVLAFLTIVSAWTFIHLLFAQHYAHEFFVERAGEMELPPEARGGLIIPGGQSVVFSDFLYFSFVIGVACQTADVAISSRPMRRLAIIHCIMSFFFNTTVLALTINIAAGLI